MAKLSEKKKVELLENAVLSKKTEEIKGIIQEYASFEFTARAFGLACVYADLETVKLLAENGFCFQYDEETGWKYKAGSTISEYYYAADYAILPALVESTIRKNFHFGTLPETESVQTTEERTAILEYLLQNPAHYGMDLPELLYYAVLWRNRAVADILINHGISLGDKQISRLTISERSWERDELNDNIQTMNAADLIFVLRTYGTLLRKTNQKLILTQGMVERKQGGVKRISELLLDTEVLKAILETADTSGIKKMSVMEYFAEQESIPSLEMVAAVGWLNANPQKEKLTQYATKNQKNSVLAWLLDYNARTTDPIKEQAKEAARMRRALTSNPSPTAELKKLWNYEKLDDGTLRITGYKGKEKEIQVPAQIGKDRVTVIGEMAFDPHAPRVRNSYERHHIERIYVPEGIIQIESMAFGSLRQLTEVALPASVEFIAESAFMATNLIIKGSIHAPAGSYAETYAKKYKIPFVAE